MTYEDRARAIVDKWTEQGLGLDHEDDADDAARMDADIAAALREVERETAERCVAVARANGRACYSTHGRLACDAVAMDIRRTLLPDDTEET